MQRKRFLGSFTEAFSTTAMGWKPCPCVSLTFTDRGRTRRVHIRACCPFSCAAFSKNSSAHFHGDGEQSRDFTYVEDVAELVLKSMHASDVAGRTFNAGNGNRYTSK